MSSSSNGIGYTKLIEMDIETDSNWPPLASKHYMLPHQEWVWTELKDLEKAVIIQRYLSPYILPTVI